MLKSLNLALLLAVILLLVTTKSTADYIDITHKNKLNVDTKFMTQKVIFAANIEDDFSSIGAGYGFRNKNYQVYAGLSYRDDETTAGFIHGFYESGRHVYEIDVTLIEKESLFKVGYSRLITESFGFYGKVSIKGDVYLGVRKWF